MGVGPPLELTMEALEVDARPLHAEIRTHQRVSNRKFWLFTGRFLGAGRRAERLKLPGLPLRALRTVEDELGRLVVCVVGEPELGIGGQPVFAAFGASRDQGSLFRAHLMSIGRSWPSARGLSV